VFPGVFIAMGAAEDSLVLTMSWVCDVPVAERVCTEEVLVSLCSATPARFSKSLMCNLSLFPGWNGLAMS
jgi:hypothetical protein